MMRAGIKSFSEHDKQLLDIATLMRRWILESTSRAGSGHPTSALSAVGRSDKDQAVVVAAGITVHEALKAYEHLVDEGVYIRVVDLYSIKPIDEETLSAAARATGVVLTVEDHYAEGGLGEAVRTALAGSGVTVHLMAVRQRPRSGTKDELLEDQGISARAIVEAIQTLNR